MTNFCSTTTVEAMRWSGHEPVGPSAVLAGAEQIVAWVQQHGGEARYEPEGWGTTNGQRVGPPRIAVRTSTGWDALLLPGWWIVKTDQWLGVANTPEIRVFVVVSDLSELRIAQQWEATT